MEQNMEQKAEQQAEQTTEQQKRKINNDVFIGIFLVLFSAFFLRETTQLHAGAAQFPRMLFVVLLIMSIVVVIFGVRKTLKPELAQKGDFDFTLKVVKNPFIAFALIVLYIVLFNTIGFFVSTTIFIPLFMVFYGARKIVPIVATTVGINLFVWVLFVRLLNVFLP